MSLCDKCKFKELNLISCEQHDIDDEDVCMDFIPDAPGPIVIHESINATTAEENDPVKSPNHYVGKIECIDYLRDKLTPEEFTGFCMGNVLKYSSRWRKKDGVQDLKKAKVYLEWAIENEEKETGT